MQDLKMLSLVCNVRGEAPSNKICASVLPCSYLWKCWKSSPMLWNDI